MTCLYSSVCQVISNGFISFGHPYPAYVPLLFPIYKNVSVVAPFWSDVDLTGGVGNVYYHVYTDAESRLMFRANKELSRLTEDFNTTWLLVATWDRVPGYHRSLTQVNNLH